MKLTARLLAFAIMVMFTAASALAHDGRPIVIDVTQTGSADVRVNIQVPDAIDPKYRPRLLLPEFCTLKGEALAGGGVAGYTYGSDYQCEKSISGSEVALDFPAFNPSLSTLFNMNYADGEAFTKLILPGNTIWTVEANTKLSGVAKDYTYLGMTHIWKGLDHLLFIVCLLLIAGTGRRILAAITGFTLAHSITLALSSLGVISLSIGAVEALIALSIVVLAAEIIRGRKDTLIWRYPILVASAFGLLHGLGFASVLGEIGLPQMHKLPALIFFNIGVEIGQILFIAVVITAVKLLSALLPRVKTEPVHKLAAYGIGFICAFWFIERSLSVLIA